jgi:hypothetical protein
MRFQSGELAGFINFYKSEKWLIFTKYLQSRYKNIIYWKKSFSLPYIHTNAEKSAFFRSKLLPNNQIFS